MTPAPQEDLNAITLLSIHDVAKRISMGKTWIYSQIKQEKFPKPVRLGAQKTAWKLTDITEWVNALPKSDAH